MERPANVFTQPRSTTEVHRKVEVAYEDFESLRRLIDAEWGRRGKKHPLGCFPVTGPGRTGPRNALLPAPLLSHAHHGTCSRERGSRES